MALYTHVVINKDGRGMDHLTSGANKCIVHSHYANAMTIVSRQVANFSWRIRDVSALWV
jgi:hypothetical protein